MPLSSIGQRFSLRRNSNYEKFADTEHTGSFICPECKTQLSDQNELQLHFASIHEVNAAGTSRSGDGNVDQLHQLQNSLRQEKAYCEKLKKLVEELQSSKAVAAGDGKLVLNDEISYYLQQIQMLEAGKALVTAQMLELEKTLAETNESLRSFERENLSLKEKCGHISKQYADVLATVDELSTEKRALSENVAALQERVVELAAELNARPADDDVAELQKGLLDSQKMMNEITCEKENEIAKLRVQQMEQRDKLTESERLIEELMNKVSEQPSPHELVNLKQAMANKDSQHSVEMNKLRHEIETKTLTVNDLESKMLTLNESLSVREREKDSISRELASLSAELTKVQDDKKKAENLLASLSDEKDGVVQKLRDLQASFDEKNSVVEKLQAKIQDVELLLTKQNDLNARLSQEIEEQNRTIDKLTVEKGNLVKEKNDILSKLQADESTSCILKQVTSEREVVEQRLQTAEQEFSHFRSNSLNETQDLKQKLAQQSLLLEEATESKRHATSKLEELSKELEKTSESLRASQTSLADKENTLVSLQKQYDTLTQQVNLLKSDNVELEKVELETRKEISEVKKAYEEEKTKVLSLEEHISDLRVNHEKDIAEKVDRHNKELENERTDKLAFDQQNSLLKKQVNELQKDLDEKSARLADLDTKLKTNQSTISQQEHESGVAIKSLQQTVEELKAECLRLQSQLNVNIETNKLECGELNVLVTSLEQTVSDLNKQRDESEKREREAQSELEKCQSKLQELEITASDQKDKIAVLTFEITSKQTAVDELHKKLMEMNVEKHGLLTEQASDRNALEGLKNQYDQLTKKHDDIKLQLKSQLDSTEDLKQKSSSDVEFLQQKLHETEQSVVELTGTLSCRDKELTEAMQLNKTLLADIDEKHSRFAVLDAERIQLNTIIADLRKHTDDQERKIKDAEQENVNLRKRCEVIEENSARLEQELLAIQEEFKRFRTASGQIKSGLEEELHTTQSELLKSQQHTDQLKNTFDVETTSLKQSLAQLQKTFGDLQIENTSLKSEYEGSKKEFRQTNQIRKDLEAQLSAWNDEKRMLMEKCVLLEKDFEEEKDNERELKRCLDDALSAMHDLGREHQSMQIDLSKHFNRKWADDRAAVDCLSCKKLFSVTVRKHHCRSCGMIFCNDCSSKVFLVAASKKPVRVCDACFTELNAH